ncbi:vWA domain-containing protein [Mycobacterium sp. NPDC050041]|uniref:vWA domain-containing protein n=1 Tax=Mycobacterium sp. NPDC050041 TaxID=3364293 RepID=UPI003C3030E1
MASWVRKTFDSHGLTQHAPGPHLSKIQDLASGLVVLCIDVSGSMAGNRLTEACAGARKFLAEATANGYKVALVSWDTSVIESYGFDAGAGAVDAVLKRGLRNGGGTNIVPALEHSHKILAGLRGDRVVAVFGDGDLGDESGAKGRAGAMHAEGIRIITLGLGHGAAAALDAISTERGEPPRVVDESNISSGIAGLARVLKK